MGELFNRIYRLDIAPAGLTGISITNFKRSLVGPEGVALNIPSGEDVQFAPEPTIIDGLKVVFRIEKTLSPVPNPAKILVHNFNESSRSFIESKDLIIRLFAGYYPEEKLLFQGNLKKVTHDKVNTDFISTISGGDGLQAFQNTVVNKSFEGPVNVETILKDAISSLGLGLGSFSVKTPSQFLQGFAMSGLARLEIDSLAEKLGAEWSIQDGQVQVIPKDGDTGEDAIVVSSDSGMIESPKRTEKGWRVLSLLNADIRPGRLINIQSTLVNGFFTVKKAVFTGDSFGQQWYVESEVE